MGSPTEISRKESLIGGLRRWSRTHIRDIRRITRTTRTTLSPRPHNCLRISMIISPVLILSIFNVSDIKKIIPQLWQSVLVYCLIILRNYQLVYTWPLIFINIDNERVEVPSWGLTEPVDYILLKILTNIHLIHTRHHWAKLSMTQRTDPCRAEDF